MSDSADLLCLTCALDLELGWFWNRDQPRSIVQPDGIDGADCEPVNLALWRMLSEHTHHELRLTGEVSREWDDVDIDALVTIGGDRTLNGWDPPVEVYLGDWPEVVARAAARCSPAALSAADVSRSAMGNPAAGSVEPLPQPVCWTCLQDRVLLPLGTLRQDEASGVRYLADTTGQPAWRSAELSHTLWGMLADHVYHECLLVDRAASVDLPADLDEFVVFRRDEQVDMED